MCLIFFFCFFLFIFFFNMDMFFPLGYSQNPRDADLHDAWLLKTCSIILNFRTLFWLLVRLIIPRYNIFLRLLFFNFDFLDFFIFFSKKTSFKYIYLGKKPVTARAESGPGAKIFKNTKGLEKWQSVINFFIHCSNLQKKSF